jgi:hypothetical protein
MPVETISISTAAGRRYFIGTSLQLDLYRSDLPLEQTAGAQRGSRRQASRKSTPMSRDSLAVKTAGTVIFVLAVRHDHLARSTLSTMSAERQASEIRA